jgi:hypothetical protein
LVHNTYRCFPEGTPSQFGVQLASIADELYTQTGLGFFEKQHTTIAVTQANNRLYVTVNGGADKRAIPKIQQAVEEMGGTFIPNPNGKSSHAEIFLYEYLNETPDTIAVSHRNGPCDACQQYFKDLDVDITYDDRWK